MQSAFARQALNPYPLQRQRRSQTTTATTSTLRRKGVGGGVMRQSSATTKIAPVTKNKQQQLQQQQLKKNQQQHHVVKTKNPSSSRSVTFAPPPPAQARDPAPTLVRMQPYMATTHHHQQQQQPSPVQHVAIPHEQFAQQEFSQLSSSTSSSLMHTSVASYNQQQKQQYQSQQQHHHHHHSQQQQHQQQHHSRQQQQQHHSQQQQVPLHQSGWSSVSGGGANRGMDASISSFPRSAASASCNSTFGMHRPGGGGASTIGKMSAGAASLHPFSISGVGSGRGGNSSHFPGHSSVFTNNSKSNSSRSTIPQQQQKSRAAKNWQIMQNMNDTAVVAPHASHRQAASTTTTTTTTPRRPTRLVVPPPASGARIAAVLVARQEQQRAAVNGAMVQQYPPAPQSAGRPHTSHASVCVARSSSKKMRGTAAVEPLLSQPSTTKTPTKTTPQQHKLRNYVASLVDDKVSTDVPALFNAKKKELDDSISTIVSGQVTALFDAKSKQLGESVSSVNHDLEAKKKEFQDNMSIASGQFTALVDAKTKELNKNLSNVNGQVTVLIGVKNELEELLSETVHDLRARTVALKEQHLELDNKAGTLIKMIQASGAEAVAKVESITETAIAKIMDAGKGWFDKITKPFRSSGRIHSQEEKSRQSSIGNTSGSRPVSSNSSTMLSPPVRALLSKKDEGKTPQTTKALSKSNTSRKISSNSSAFVSPPARKVEGKGDKLQSSTVMGKDRPPKHITTAGVTVKVKDKTVKKKKHEVKKKTSNKAGGKSKKSHPPPKKTVHEDDVDARFQDLVNLGPVPRSRSSRSNKKRTMDKESPLLPISPSKRARTITTPVQKSVPASVHLPAIKQTSQLSQRSSSVATPATTVKSQQVPTRSRVTGTFGRNARYAAALSDSDTILY